MVEQFEQLDLSGVSPEVRERLRLALSREFDTIQSEKQEEARRAEQSRLEAEFQERLREAYEQEVAATPRGFAGIDARQHIRRKYRKQGYEPQAEEPGIWKLMRERGEVEVQQPPALPTEGAGGVSTVALLEEYRSLIKNIPVGAAGIDARFKAMQEIRKRAEQAGIQSPV